MCFYLCMKNNVQFHIVEHSSVFAKNILFFKLLSKCFIKTLLLAFVLESVTFVAIFSSLTSEVYFLQTTGHIFPEVVRYSFGPGSLSIYTEHQEHPNMV